MDSKWERVTEEARRYGYAEKMQDCTLCPRNCHADRLSGQKGYCGQTARIRAARAALHYWEEPCISGRAGSGAVFFCGCPLRCVFCQNSRIAAGEAGREVSVEELSRAFLRLQEKGANNINLVTPTHFVPQIAAALRLSKKEGLKIPVVYNTGSYEKAETLKLMEGLVDLYLPDLKYASKEPAERYSHAPDYFETACEAIAEMVRQVPEAVFEIPQATYFAWVDMSKVLPDVEDMPLFFANNAGVLLEGGDELFVGNAKGCLMSRLSS